MAGTAAGTPSNQGPRAREKREGKETRRVGLRRRLTCFKPPEHAVIGVLYGGEPRDFGGEQDAKGKVATAQVVVLEPIGSGPEGLGGIEQQVYFRVREAGAGLVAADGDGEAGCSEEATVVLDAGADDAFDGELGETKVASIGVRAPALVALES